jgi:hypothetical protein
MGGPPPKLPPLREVNHSILLIDETKIYSYYLPKCADAYKEEFHKKVAQYVENGWWEAKVAPMLCIPKSHKDPWLRTPIDLRKRNANTVRDVTPLLDQDHI